MDADMEVETYTVSSTVVGVFIIGSSLIVGLLFCVGVCLVSQIRRKNANGLDCGPSNCCIHKQNKSKYSLEDDTPPTLQFFPSVAYSETGSDSCATRTSFGPSSPLTEGRKKSFQTFLDEQSRKVNSYDHGPCQIDHSYPSWFQRNLDPCSSRTLVRPSFRFPFSERGSRPSSSAHVNQQNMPFTWTSGLSPKRNLLSPRRLSPSRQTLSLQSIRSGTHCNLRIGLVTLEIRYEIDQQVFRVELRKDFQLPNVLGAQITDMYAKFSLTSDELKIKVISPIVENEGSYCAAFQKELPLEKLCDATLTLVLTKKGDSNVDHRVVVGSCTTRLSDLGLSETLHENFKTVVSLPLVETSHQPNVACGGFLLFDLSYQSETETLILSNIYFDGFDISEIECVEPSNLAYPIELYLKGVIYHEGSAISWRRTPSVFLNKNTTSVYITPQLSLPVAPKHTKEIQLVLTLKQKMTKRGKRRLLGELVVDTSTMNIVCRPDGNKRWIVPIKGSLE